MEAPILSLYELNNLVRGVLSQTFNQFYWIRAEMSDVRVNQNGHCYLEFTEKDGNNRTIIAKARGSIWANVFRLLHPYFESETGQIFASGLKVLVQVSVEFHELYGYSLNVHNIDPSYTLGDQAHNRQMILKQLEEDGVLTLNRELTLPALPSRIAIISSPTAAGYEDFCNQLENNLEGFIFYTHLFPAIMQGERTEDSVIAALERIYEHQSVFDAVVIIRGGGASSDLASFDSYLLAASCAQFPLPIITGIGHERDDTVLDIVAHTRMKTPTAVAEFLVRKVQSKADFIYDLQERISQKMRLILQKNEHVLGTLFSKFAYLTKDYTKDQLAFLSSYKERINSIYGRNTISCFSALETLSKQISYTVSKNIETKKKRLEHIEQYLKLVSPAHILRKGYTLTLKGNKIVKSVNDISSGDHLSTRFYDGEIEVLAEKVKYNKTIYPNKKSDGAIS